MIQSFYGAIERGVVERRSCIAKSSANVELHGVSDTISSHHSNLHRLIPSPLILHVSTPGGAENSVYRGAPAAEPCRTCR
jgi:hypothetical protein